MVYHYSDGSLEYEEHFNATGTLQEVLKYSYDADGNVEYLLYKDNNFSNASAYDLYYYDLQTGWYQLGSRFYDPEVGRFLNADDVSLLMETDSGVVDKNLYAYCDGNPVMRKDDGGECWNILVGAAAGLVLNSAVQIATNIIGGQKWSDGLGKAAITGAISGGLAATGVGLIASSGINAGVSGLANAGNQIIKNKGLKSFSVGSLLNETIGGALSGGRGMGNFVKLGTLNRQLTKKVASQSLTIAKKGLKYYYSQTKSTYSRYLFRPMRRGTIVSLFYNGGWALYKRWK